MAEYFFTSRYLWFMDIYDVYLTSMMSPTERAPRFTFTFCFFTNVLFHFLTCFTLFLLFIVLTNICFIMDVRCTKCTNKLLFYYYRHTALSEISNRRVGKNITTHYFDIMHYIFFGLGFTNIVVWSSGTVWCKDEVWSAYCARTMI